MTRAPSAYAPHPAASAYRPVAVGERFLVVPPGVEVPPGDRIPLVLVRGGFGSGEHETTASCLDALAEWPSLRGADVLDFGSGTGVLAIAACKLGARSVACVEIDPAAVANARHNCGLNGMAGRVTHVTGSLERLGPGRFDLTLANVQADVLLRYTDGLCARTQPGGGLVLSGVLWEHGYDVRRAYERCGCEVVRNLMLEVWSTLVLRRCQSAS